MPCKAIGLCRLHRSSRFSSGDGCLTREYIYLQHRSRMIKITATPAETAPIIIPKFGEDDVESSEESDVSGLLDTG